MVFYPYMDNYIGDWENADGKRLIIRKVDDENALVTFLASDHRPIRRPWYDNAPSVDMTAWYDDSEGPLLTVRLGKEGMGFDLLINFEASYELDSERRDSLVVSPTRYIDDEYLDQYFLLFFPLHHYTRTVSS